MNYVFLVWSIEQYEDEGCEDADDCVEMVLEPDAVYFLTESDDDSRKSYLQQGQSKAFQDGYSSENCLFKLVTEEEWEKIQYGESIDGEDDDDDVEDEEEDEDDV